MCVSMAPSVHGEIIARIIRVTGSNCNSFESMDVSLVNALEAPAIEQSDSPRGAKAGFGVRVMKTFQPCQCSGLTFPVALRHWNPTAHAKSLAGDLEPGRGLAAFVFGSVDQPHHTFHVGLAETCFDDGCG